jgi:predicted esterase YcpF (UPF0227 family)
MAAAAGRITHLLYLHGFRSSPASAKARLMAQAVAQRYPLTQWCCPQLPPSPRQAANGMLRLTADWPRATMAVVGSSLGGFYASWVARQTGCRSVLLNPAVFPARDLARHIGAQSQWHAPDEQFYFQESYIAELQAMADEGIHAPGPELALISQRDEVLDWREMQARYPQARRILLPEGDHTISDFALHLDTVLEFLDLV